MPLTRLIYFSENQIDRTRGSALDEFRSILAISNQNNQALNLTGALVFDDGWFLQALEGERKQVWQTLRRIEEDERHSNLTVVEAGETASRIFGNWWMGAAVRDAKTEAVFRPFLRNGVLHPEQMTASDILNLMVDLARFGLSRRLASAA